MKKVIVTSFIGSMILGTSLSAQQADTPNTLEVAPAHADMGTVYHTLPDIQTRVVFSSEAPLENIQGTARVLGYGVVNAAENAVAGTWQVPVTSLATGIDLRDEHLQGEEWLDAETHPYIVFNLTGVEDVEILREVEGVMSARKMTLIGELTMRGVTHELRIPEATVTHLVASERTAQVAAGDLLQIRCAYDVNIEDYGVEHSAIKNDRVSKIIHLEQVLYLSTIGPDAQSME